MQEQKLKSRIGTGIAEHRRKAGLTQVELADQIGYSDKAVSKWERGESVPDVMTLVQLTELFGITVNDLLQQEAPPPEEQARPRRANRGVIQMLSSILVWFVALLSFVVLSSIGLPNSWLAFLAAIPVNAIVLLSLRSAWRNFTWNCPLISVIMWGTLLSLYVFLLVLAELNLWKIFLLGIPGQAAILLWFQMFRPGKLRGKDNG